MKYSLRSLMIVVLVGPPLLAVGWHLVRVTHGPHELVRNCDQITITLDDLEMALAEYKQQHP